MVRECPLALWGDAGATTEMVLSAGIAATRAWIPCAHSPSSLVTRMCMYPSSDPVLCAGPSSPAADPRNHNAKEETSHVRPYSDSLSCAERALEQLHHEPDAEEDPGRQAHDGDKDEKDQGLNLGFGIQEEICSHDGSDGAARPDGRDLRGGSGKQLNYGGHHAARQVKQQVLVVTEIILDVVAKDPQEQHVAQNMAPAAVDEHRCQGRQEIRCYRP